MKQIQLVCEQSQRLDSFVAENATLTRSHAQKLVQGGSVTVDGAVVTKCSLVVKEDSVVCVTLPDEQSLDIPAQDIPLDILYEDSHMAVINKQQGLTVHPANGVNTDTLVNALLFHIKDLSGINGVLRPGIVHRLDKDTSGLLVVAKNDQAHVELQRQIQTKECKRIYWALVEGVVKQDQGIVNQPIGRCPADRKRMDIVAGGRQAETHFTVLKRFDRYTLMQFELKTGRTHQIRVHSRFLGHPVVGDKTYGFKNCKFNLSGQLLHAKTISFTHPVSGEQMTFSAPLPSYFDKILQTLTNKSK